MRTYVAFRKIWLPAVALSAALALAGCKDTPNQAQIINQPADGSDPAAANMANPDGSPAQQGNTQVMGTSAQYTPTQSGESYPQQAAAPVQQAYYDNSQDAYDDGYDDGQQAVYANQAPPPLPEYEQPVAPGDDYLWTPGYWGYADTGYYWVPGAWVYPPYVGALWTPGYWGWFGGRYRWHGGYWGRHIGYYGGINYGWGYGGYGYEGGYWRGNNFYYNRAVNRVGPSVRNVYSHPVTVVHTRYSYNGPGGYNARPRPNEVAAMREQRTRPMETQIAMHREAQNNRGNAFSQNHGRPAEAAFSHPIQRGAAAPLPAVRAGFGGNAGRPNGARPGNEGRPGQPGFNPQQQRGLMEQNRGQQQTNRGGFGNNVRPGQPGFAPQNQQRGLLQQNQEQVRQEQQRNQQALQQREQANQQRQQNTRQREQMLQQRQQVNVQQQNAQREQMNAQRQQQNAQRSQMLQQRQEQMQQRQQQMQQRAAPAPRAEAPRPAPQQHMEAPRPAPQQHMEAPRPAPHMEAPHAAPAAPHGGGGGGHPEGGHSGGHH